VLGAAGIGASWFHSPGRFDSRRATPVESVQGASGPNTRQRLFEGMPLYRLAFRTTLTGVSRLLVETRWSQAACLAKDVT
jgi:hypothetical protein